MSSDADIHHSHPQPPQGDGLAPVSERRGGEVVRLLPISVLVLSPDRYFRTAATMLLSRRGCTVLSAAEENEARDQALLEPVDVLVLEPAAADAVQRHARVVAELIDRAALGAGRRVAPVGVVVVGEPEQLGETLEADALTDRPALDKWGPFERLYQAIADRDRARRLAPESAALLWPASARRPGAD